MEPGPLGELLAQQAHVPVGQAYERHRMFSQTTAALLRDWERGRLWADNAASLVCHAADAYRRDVSRVALPSSRDEPGQYQCAPRVMDASRGSMDMPPAAPAPTTRRPPAIHLSRGDFPDDMPDSLTLGDLIARGTLRFRDSPDASVFGGRGSSDRAPCRRRSRSRGDGVSKSA